MLEERLQEFVTAGNPPWVSDTTPIHAGNTVLLLDLKMECVEGRSYTALHTHTHTHTNTHVDIGLSRLLAYA